MKNIIKNKIRLQLFLFIIGLVLLLLTAVSLVLNLVFNKNISIIIILGSFVTSNMSLLFALQNMKKNNHKKNNKN